MKTTEELAELLQQARLRPDRIAPFLRGMLDAPIYALAPLHDDHPKLRLSMFKRPNDGVYFIPLFTDEAKAVASARNQLRVLTDMGRLWLEVSRGAVVVINPNDEHCTLYPEEIEDLLASGRVVDFGYEQLAEEKQVGIRNPDSTPDWLVRDLRALYATLPFVEEARLFEMGPPEEPFEGVLTIAITTTKMYGERAARATIAAMQQACVSKNLMVDVVLTISDDPEPGFVGHGVQIYSKQI